MCYPCARVETARDAAQVMHAVNAASVAAGGVGVAPQHQYSSGVAPRASLPRSSAHEALEKRGATVQQSALSSTTSVGPVSTTREGVREVWTFPAPLAVQATFASEGFFTMVKKLFSREVQVGDEAFDSAVDIQTSTPDATKAWLESPDVRVAATLP